MRTLYFLVPGTGAKFACGGLWAELKTFNLAKQVCNSEVVTYRQREKNTLFIDQVLQNKDLDEAIFVISWGFDIAKLVAKLKHHHVVYHAHSAGYKFNLPANIPIVTVSRNTMGYWGQKSPNSLIYYLPNQIGEEFSNFHLERDIDVLVQKRKSSQYLMQQLIPALQKQCNVFVVDSYVENLAKLFNRTKVYLYDSAEYWAVQGVSEGFGLQPLEAMACGCQVFSSINNGLSDYLDPGFNCYKIAGYSQQYDVQRILKVVASPLTFDLPEQILKEYRVKNITQRLQIILEDINSFFDGNYNADIKSLTRIQTTKLLVQNNLNKLKKKLSK
ncbi:glycosyltransferase [Synechocystis sp. PCC 7509]|uniref:glycosyltransferase n=1 Tax=Synechocystis sp. PCC 7509 TaxID=927677 RepID=UPI0002ACFD08|nr:glycosyltransferase [Synechocystis sp. PCC 7509]